VRPYCPGLKKDTLKGEARGINMKGVELSERCLILGAPAVRASRAVTLKRHYQEINKKGVES
jgi:hypothetical protein